MNFIAAYAHIRNEEDKERARINLLTKHLKQAFSNDQDQVVYFRNTRLSRDLKEALTNISSKDKDGPLRPVVWFIHLTPFIEESKSPADDFGNATGAVERLHIVFVSGGGLQSNTTYLSKSIQAAKDKGFGGCTYWPDDIDNSGPKLTSAFIRLNECFRPENQLSFKEFDKAINRPDFLPEIQIIDQFLTQITKDDNPRLQRILGKYASDPSLLYFGLADAPKEQLLKIIEDRRNFEQLRSRLRHHDLTNNFLLAARTLLDPEQAKERPQGVEELKQKINRYSGDDDVFKSIDSEIEHLVELADSLKFGNLQKTIYPDLKVTCADKITPWVETLKVTKKKLKESAKGVSQIRLESTHENIVSSIEGFIQALEECIEALKSPSA